MSEVDKILEAMGQLIETDLECVDQGLIDGAYANAYETEDYDSTQESLSGTNGFYRVGHLLGFFGTYELHEIPAHWREEADLHRHAFDALGIDY